MSKAPSCGRGDVGGNLPGVSSRPATRKPPHLNHRHHSVAVVPCHVVSHPAGQDHLVAQRSLEGFAYSEFY